MSWYCSEYTFTWPVIIVCKTLKLPNANGEKVSMCKICQSLNHCRGVFSILLREGLSKLLRHLWIQRV